MLKTQRVGFFQGAIIFYIDKKEGKIKMALKDQYNLMYQFKGLIFNMDSEYTGKFPDLVSAWVVENKTDNYFMTKEKFLEELERECLGCNQMKLFGIFRGLLENAEGVIIKECGTVAGV